MKIRDTKGPGLRLSVLLAVLMYAGLLPGPAAGTAAGSASVLAASTDSQPRAQSLAQRPAFSPDRVMVHIHALAGRIGVRKAGSPAEARASAYIIAKLRGFGYAPVVSSFPIPGGRSQNVHIMINGKPLAGAPQPDKRYLIVGAHMDSKWPSPGANDNASGVGTLLELARVWKASPPPVSVKLVFFGAEEIVDRNRDHHHYGSRFLAAQTKPATGLIGMISVDDVGFGRNLHVRSMGKGPSTLWRRLLAVRSAAKLNATYLRDPGWSDHEPFERRGYAVAWIEYRPDPAGHTRRDIPARINRYHLGTAGRWLLTYFDSLDAAALNALARS